MPSTIGLPLNAGQLPYTCYPANPQTLINDAFRLGSATMPNIRGVVISDSRPATGDQDKFWVKTSSSAPVGQFIFYNGAWVWPHATPAGGSERRLWVGTLADLITYDGGDVNALGSASGAMWQQDTDFNDRIPIGATATYPVNANSGAATQTLISANLPDHTHEIGCEVSDYAAGSNIAGRFRATGGGANFYYDQAVSTTVRGLTRVLGTVATSFSILPPIRGIFFIKRTSRTYIVG